MTMKMTRKEFLGAAGSGTIVLLLQSCGGGGGSNTVGGTVQSGCGSTGAAISGNHGHSLTIAMADLDSTTDKTYSIMGTATHDHTITLTVAQLRALKAGQGATVNSKLQFHIAIIETKSPKSSRFTRLRALIFVVKAKLRLNRRWRWTVAGLAIDPC